MKKAIVIGFVVLLVVIGAGVYVFLAGLDEIVRAAVQKVGSDVTKVEVTLDRAEVAPTEGRAALHGLVVGNPPGFKAESAFAMGSISVTLDAATVTQDPIVIKEVAITNPEVTYELGAEGSNIDAINKNVQASGSGESKTSDAEGPKVIIENLYVRGGKVNVSAAPLGGSSMTADLPEIHLQDIGKDKGGASPGEVAEKVMAALTSQVGSFVGGLDLSSVLKGVSDLPEGLKGLAGGALENPGAATEGAQDAVKGVGEEAGDAVKKLLGD